MLDELTADAIRAWSRLALDALRRHRSEIDALNVFPVPDGDTGTNMVLTMAAADAELSRLGANASPAEAASCLARGALTGARGNSGVIVSQLLRGIAEAAREGPAVDGEALRRGLRLGAKQAQQAVAEPAEGTILTVAQAAADAVADDADLARCVRSALDAAEVALEHTVEQHPVLAEAGVVDAGARGYVFVLAALHEAVTGERRYLDDPPPPSVAPAPAVRETGSEEFGYEVQYLLDAPADSGDIASLRDDLSALGDSVVVVGTGDGTWNVHVHTNDVGAAVEAGVRVGRPHRISVVRFTDQHGSADAGGADTAATGVVAVAPGAGLAHLFAGAGVQVVDGAEPTADDVAAVASVIGATGLVLVPVGRAAARAAEAAAEALRESGRRTTVVPTRSPVQALAAVAVHDARRRFDDDVVAMAEAAAATRFAEITIAEGDGLTSVGMCHAGDVLGLIDGEVVEIGRGMLAVALSLVDRLLAVGAELLTVLVAEQAPAGIGEQVSRHVRGRAPLTEVTVYPAGQAVHPLVIGVE